MWRPHNLNLQHEKGADVPFWFIMSQKSIVLNIFLGAGMLQVVTTGAFLSWFYAFNVFITNWTVVFTAKCTRVQSTILRSHVVCLSICLSATVVDHDHVGWKSWKLIARTISPPSSLFVAQRSSTYSQGNTEKFWGENVRSTPMSITSGWIESTESHMILGGGVDFFTFCRCIARSSLR